MPTITFTSSEFELLKNAVRAAKADAHSKRTMIRGGGFGKLSKDIEALEELIDRGGVEVIPKDHIVGNLSFRRQDYSKPDRKRFVVLTKGERMDSYGYNVKAEMTLSGEGWIVDIRSTMSPGLVFPTFRRAREYVLEALTKGGL